MLNLITSPGIIPVDFLLFKSQPIAFNIKYYIILLELMFELT